MHERYHSTMDDARAADKKARAAQGRRRAIRREEREKRAEQERERFVAETVGRATIKVQKQGEQRAVVATVAGTLKLFVRERRNDMSAEAMAAFLDKPHFYSADAIAAALEELRASGEYDRIVAEAGLPAAPLQHLPVSG
jgi:hypothetical protein